MIAHLLATVTAFDEVDPAYLLEARQMQALSLGVHIPLVCFGIAFPAIVLFMEGLHLRTGDPVYKALAKRWSKVMLILFAVGVVTGTILSFELGLLWPQFMEKFGEVFGIAFALRASPSSSRRSSSRSTSTAGTGSRRAPTSSSGIPIVITGIAGSMFVIAVNGWMNNPSGFTLDADGEVTDVDPFAALFNSKPLARAGPHVPGRVHRRRLPRRRRLRVRLAERHARPLPPRRADRAARGRLPGGAGAAGGRRLGRADGRREPADEAGRDRGPRTRRPRAPT